MAGFHPTLPGGLSLGGWGVDDTRGDVVYLILLVSS
jgi:hypothetical protein